MIYEEEVMANKRLRQEIDVKIQEVKELPCSRERSLCITKLQEAVMWLGMDLKRLGPLTLIHQVKTHQREQKLNPPRMD